MRASVNCPVHSVTESYLHSEDEAAAWVEGTFDRIVGNPATDNEARMGAEFGGMHGPEVKATQVRSVGSQEIPLAFDQENKQSPKTGRTTSPLAFDCPCSSL